MRSGLPEKILSSGKGLKSMGNVTNKWNKHRYVKKEIDVVLNKCQYI